MLTPADIEAVGARLLQRGLLDETALARAKQAADRSGERIDVVLSRLGIVTEADLAVTFADLLGLPRVTAADIPERPVLADALKPTFLRANKLIPVADTNGEVTVAMTDPFNTAVVEAIAYLLERPVRRAVISPAEFERGFELLYTDAVANSGLAVMAAEAEVSDDDVRRLMDLASEAPVIRLVNELISKAVEEGASDIHIEPESSDVGVRYRVDGVLRFIRSVQRSALPAITSRIKVMAKLNIAERRLPQDGRIRIPVRGTDVDLRVSTLPTLHGESVVLRVLDRSAVQLDLPALGFAEAMLRSYVDLLGHPNGIILVTGPTGSGKTTTLYASLLLLNRRERKIITIEEPIEYELPGIRQTQVRPAIEFGFAQALRSILRHDPDVIMVGEIRDYETVEIAVQSSLTGHLVFSTLHTNSAAATLARLLDMGVEAFLIASSIRGILAQRLVRRLCRHCSVPAKISSEQKRWLLDASPSAGKHPLSEPSLLRAAKGCRKCGHTGYAGRICIGELLVVNSKMRELIVGRASERSIQEAAVAAGMVPMLSDGTAKVLAGETTIEEVMRATRAIE
ncbi:MAG: type II/IV secretion system protein [Hyphomicrobiaceae bacterium]|nr:MAG: type II/IV secretion system protein [Hyphomicrobiaceae bacterium]